MKHTPSEYSDVRAFINAAIAAGVDIHKYADPEDGEAAFCPEFEDGNIVMIYAIDPALLWFDDSLVVERYEVDAGELGAVKCYAESFEAALPLAARYLGSVAHSFTFNDAGDGAPAWYASANVFNKSGEKIGQWSVANLTQKGDSPAWKDESPAWPPCQNPDDHDFEPVWIAGQSHVRCRRCGTYD